MSRRRNSKGRDLDGILLLDKPAGITSNDALQKVKRLFDARKAGHTGSLDKTATGLLPLCFGDACKFSSFLLDADKYYRAKCQLGAETRTGDAAGEITVENAVPNLSEDTLNGILNEFCGEISQIPPMFSALKQNGQRLYKLAYKGEEVERAPRAVTIHQISLRELTATHFEIDVICSKGTYIRTLAEDIGRRIGCGAHVSTLRRLGSGPYNAEAMIDMSGLVLLARQGQAQLDKALVSIDSALVNLPELCLSESIVFYLCQGQAVTVSNAPTEGLVRLYKQGKAFIGLGEVLDDGRIKPRRLVKL
jgi:tRNA pseudouridine55 synthase